MSIHVLSGLIIIFPAMIHAQPNIIFMWFDDLGFADVEYNGGPYPTPVLDDLVSTNAIKLNFHYSEALCSPSRSSFFTGKYSWKSGLNTVALLNSHRHVMNDSVFFTQLLQQNNYNTFLAGKWHIGYKYSSVLPARRGFDHGLYNHLGTQYYTRQFEQSFSKLDKSYPASKRAVTNTRDEYFPDQKLPIHDSFETRDGIDQIPVLVGDNTYNEKLYAEAIIDFIDNQTMDNPFYIHYSLFTPHSSVETPPDLSDDFEYDYSICNVNGLPTKKRKFCRAMLYAQEKVDDIINKVKDMGFWNNTIVVITSDNGPTPQDDNGQDSYGQTLPLRGIKGSVHEGGIRTPAFIIGGYIEDLVDTNTKSLCEYDEMVHISDWYDILTAIADINHTESDSDHSTLQIWQDIQCKCNTACKGSSNNVATSRDELIMMRMCGDINDPHDEVTYYATAYIKKPWKLIVNGSYPMNDKCPNNKNFEGVTEKISYTEYDGNHYETPNQTFFTEWYKPQISAPAKNRKRGRNLYESECYEDMNAKERNNESLPEFEYTEFQLFNLNTDKIEACNLAESKPAKVNELWTELQSRAFDYNVEENVEDSVGALWELVNTYDCNVTYLTPWEGKNENKCGAPADTYDNVTARDCTEIWKTLNDIKEECVLNGRRRMIIEKDDYFENNAAFYWILSVLVVFGLMIMFRAALCNGEKKAVSVDVDGCELLVGLEV